MSPTASAPRHTILCSDTVLEGLRCAAGGSGNSKCALCPQCQRRTKLYRLGDGRRKCAVCGKRFSPGGRRDERRLRQLADILLYFCLDFPALRTSAITGYRQPTVDRLYRNIRQAITRENWDTKRIRLASGLETTDREFSSAFCRRCRRRSGCRGRVCSDAPVFGVCMEKSGEVLLDPLADEPLLQDGMYVPPIIRGAPKDPYAQYGGFICHGTFHRFTDRQKDGHMRDGLEQFWSWAEERLRRYHGMHTENLGFYLKELEWKYNHRVMGPEEQALALIPLLLPSDWFLRNEGKYRGDNAVPRGGRRVCDRRR